MRRPGRAAAALSSLLAAAALTGCSTPADPPPEATATFAPRGKVVCNEEAYRAPAAGAWRHPQQNFYAPGEPAPTESDLDHLMLMDAAAVVRYRPDAPPGEREELREWAATAPAQIVVPSRAKSPPPVEAFTSNRHLICDGVDEKQLGVFALRRGTLQVTPHDDQGKG